MLYGSAGFVAGHVANGGGTTSWQQALVLLKDGGFFIGFTILDCKHTKFVNRNSKIQNHEEVIVYG